MVNNAKTTLECATLRDQRTQDCHKDNQCASLFTLCVLDSELILELSRDASFITTVNEVGLLLDQRGGFPLSEYLNLMHMIYNPVDHRYYKQAAVAAYREGKTW
jgi:hypothetical protein